MQFGKHLRELSKLRGGLIASAVLALAVAFTSIYKIGLLPPKIQPRALELGAATTQVIVDTPVSQAADLSNINSDPLAMLALNTRADLLGNVMASTPVRSYIARLVGVDASQIQATTPITANVPRSVTEPPSAARATDLVASTDHYKIDIQVDPTVPVITIASEGPSEDSAVRLANAAVQGLRQYLTDLSLRQNVPPSRQVKLEQLGPAHGGVVNKGMAVEVAMLVFLGVFGICCCAVLFLSRARQGWSIAKLSERTNP
jgi:hypothetical protein